MRQHYQVSAPGRTEIGGNHTDHQQGCVLAAAVDLETVADVILNGTDWINIHSEGYPLIRINLNELHVHPEEQNTTAALVRGVADGFVQHGFELGGFDAKVHSSVLPGSGLSSSAAFEILIATIMNDLFCNSRLPASELAQIAKYAENQFFGKPCGLMDQLASATGGLVFMDFANPYEPKVEKINFDFAATNHALCIIDTGADHADLTEEYAAITKELLAVCQKFGKRYLREIPETEFMKALPEIRGKVPDRALLRAIHVYQENKRVVKEAEALKNGDFDAFLKLVIESGKSSWMYLQNIYPLGERSWQDVAVTLALCETLLEGRGAYRVHGGGFGGTVQAFVPNDMLDHFVQQIEKVTGNGSCHVMSIRKMGGIRLN